jgi:hypothetical protein
MNNNLRHKNYYRTRRIVRIVFWTTLALAFYHVVTHIWWTDGGYCWGTMVECMLKENQ